MNKHIFTVLITMGMLLLYGCTKDSDPDIQVERPVIKPDPEPDPKPIPKPEPEKSNTKIIAHRGFWKPAEKDQNTVKALIKANELGVYGSEFDIHLTSDFIPVAAHDATVILGSKSYAINDYPYSTFEGKILDSGVKLETLNDFLKTAKEKCKSIVLFIELKTQKTKNLNLKLAEETIQAVRAANMQNRVEYISFGEDIVKEIARLDPNAKVAFLDQTKPLATADEVKAMGATGWDYYYVLVKPDPTLISKASALGLSTNVWTVNSTSDLSYFIRQEVDYITTDEPELAWDLVKTTDL